MRKLLLAVAASALVAACGGGDDPKNTEPVGPCTELRGAYLIKWVQRAGGTCGSITEQVVIIEPGKTSPECTASITTSADKCESYGTVTCGTLRTNVSCKGSGDGRTMSCVWTAASDDPANLCTSTYDVTYTKQ